jgi:lipopolysaccharide assembly outer membrane protein LptD (OstA)
MSPSWRRKFPALALALSTFFSQSKWASPQSLFGSLIFRLYAVLAFGCVAPAQFMQPPMRIPAPTAQAQSSARPLPSSLASRAAKIPRSEMLVEAVTQELDGAWRRLRGHAKVEVTEMSIAADEIDYSEETGDVEARGNVHYQNFETGEELWAARIEYNCRADRQVLPRARYSPRQDRTASTCAHLHEPLLISKANGRSGSRKSTCCTRASSPAASCPGRGGL